MQAIMAGIQPPFAPFVHPKPTLAGAWPPVTAFSSARPELKISIPQIPAWVGDLAGQGARGYRHRRREKHF